MKRCYGEYRGCRQVVVDSQSTSVHVETRSRGRITSVSYHTRRRRRRGSAARDAGARRTSRLQTS